MAATSSTSWLSLKPGCSVPAGGGSVVCKTFISTSTTTLFLPPTIVSVTESPISSPLSAPLGSSQSTTPSTPVSSTTSLATPPEAAPPETQAPLPAVSTGPSNGTVAGIVIGILLAILFSALLFWLWRAYQSRSWPFGNRRGSDGDEPRPPNQAVRWSIDYEHELAALAGRGPGDDKESGSRWDSWRSHLPFQTTGPGGKIKTALSGTGRRARDGAVAGDWEQSTIQNGRPSLEPPHFPRLAYLYDGSVHSFDTAQEARDFTNHVPRSNLLTAARPSADSARHIYRYHVNTTAKDLPLDTENPFAGGRDSTPSKGFQRLGSDSNLGSRYQNFVPPFPFSARDSPFEALKADKSLPSSMPTISTSGRPIRSVESLLSRTTPITKMDSKYQEFDKNRFLENFYENREFDRQSVKTKSPGSVGSHGQSPAAGYPRLPPKLKVRQRYEIDGGHSEVSGRSAGHEVTGMEWILNVDRREMEEGKDGEDRPIGLGIKNLPVGWI